MQFERAADGTLTPLPKPSVDTGMGLERIAAVMQGVHTNYDIDLFRELIGAAARARRHRRTSTNPSLRVIADHIRACSFLIADGVLPSNEGRGYVLRRIMRRAMRHGHKLGITEPFFHKLSPPLERRDGRGLSGARQAASAPGRERAARRKKSGSRDARQGHGRCSRTRSREPAARRRNVIDGETVFKLYDTYGFPVDLTADIARERGLASTRPASRRRWRRSASAPARPASFGVDLRAACSSSDAADFSGYDGTQRRGPRRRAARATASASPSSSAGERGEVVLDAHAVLRRVRRPGRRHRRARRRRRRASWSRTRRSAAARVLARRRASPSGAHRGGRAARRAASMRAPRSATAPNHTATHLLHAALREVLGTHVQQKGSLVAPERLRFDFAHFQPVTADELRAHRAAGQRADPRQRARPRPARWTTTRRSRAGAMALFGEKYERRCACCASATSRSSSAAARTSQRAGDIGLFKIVSEGGVAAGVRRIEAVTGAGRARRTSSRPTTRCASRRRLVRGTRDDVAAKVRDALDRIRQLEKENRALKDKLAVGAGHGSRRRRGRYRAA